jgi:8-oxo-dGTP pyrophosphatase MutT (NUDIX family)
MASDPQFMFQYIQKLVILSPDHSNVLLAKRKGEADYDGTFSFIGGKMETSDPSIIAGMKREKDEEIGPGTVVRILPPESYNVLFRKKDGNTTICPHIAGVFVSGDIILSDEYSEYQWVALAELDQFEPKIPNIPSITRWAIKKLEQADPSGLTAI